MYNHPYRKKQRNILLNVLIFFIILGLSISCSTSSGVNLLGDSKKFTVYLSNYDHEFGRLMEHLKSLRRLTIYIEQLNQDRFTGYQEDINIKINHDYDKIITLFVASDNIIKNIINRLIGNLNIDIDEIQNDVNVIDKGLSLLTPESLFISSVENLFLKLVKSEENYITSKNIVKEIIQNKEIILKTLSNVNHVKMMILETYYSDLNKINNYTVHIINNNYKKSTQSLNLENLQVISLLNKMLILNEKIKQKKIYGIFKTHQETIIDFINQFHENKYNVHEKLNDEVDNIISTTNKKILNITKQLKTINDFLDGVDFFHTKNIMSF